MAESDRFELVPTPDCRWGVTTRSQVRFNGCPTDLTLDGSILLAQHETYSGFLLWVSYERPLDGVLRLYLLSPGITVLDAREIGSEISGGSLRGLSAADDDEFEFSFFEGDRWRLRMLKEARREWFRQAHAWSHGVARGAEWRVYGDKYLELERLQSGTEWWLT